MSKTRKAYKGFFDQEDYEWDNLNEHKKSKKKMDVRQLRKMKIALKTLDLNELSSNEKN